LLIAAFTGLAGPAWAAEAPILSTLQGAEKARVAKLIEGAKKEGTFSYTSNFVPTGAAPLLEKEFKRLYGLEGLKFSFADRRSGTIIKRVEQEIRADKLSVDVLILATVSWLHSMRKRGELLKYESPEDKYYTAAAKANMNAPGYWVADGQIFTMAANRDVAGNVSFTSWYDILDPKFSGKIILGDASRSETITLWYRGLRQVLPKSYFEKLATVKPTLILRGAQQRRALMAREYIYSASTMVRHNWIARQKGVNLSPFYPKEGVVALPICSVILAKAKHPNAAKLFIDFWRSVKGKQILLSHNPINVGRSNFPPHPDPKIEKNVLAKDGIAPPLDKINIIPIEWDKISPAEVKKWRAEFVSIFGRGKKK